MKDRFIVAEVSKSWENPHRIDDLLSKQFEMVINTNLRRGYELKDWKINSYQSDSGVHTETIIAVFETIESNDR